MAVQNGSGKICACGVDPVWHACAPCNCRLPNGIGCDAMKLVQHLHAGFTFTVTGQQAHTENVFDEGV
jgi:hypothetical protein